MRTDAWLSLIWLLSFVGWLGGYYTIGINWFTEVCLAVWVVGLLFALMGGVLFWVNFGLNVERNVIKEAIRESRDEGPENWKD